MMKEIKENIWMVVIELAWLVFIVAKAVFYDVETIDGLRTFVGSIIIGLMFITAATMKEDKLFEDNE